MGFLGKALQAAARATHSLTCGEPERESNETKYLREATEVIEEWQFRLQGWQRMSAPASDHGEVILSLSRCRERCVCLPMNKCSV